MRGMALFVYSRGVRRTITNEARATEFGAYRIHSMVSPLYDERRDGPTQLTAWRR